MDTLDFIRVTLSKRDERWRVYSFVEGRVLSDHSTESEAREAATVEVRRLLAEVERDAHRYRFMASRRRERFSEWDCSKEALDAEVDDLISRLPRLESCTAS